MLLLCTDYEARAFEEGGIVERSDLHDDAARGRREAAAMCRRRSKHLAHALTLQVL